MPTMSSSLVARRPRRLSREFGSPWSRDNTVLKSEQLPLTMYASAANGDVRAVMSWLDRGNHVDARCPEAVNGTLLMASSIEGRTVLVRKLLQRLANPDLACNAGGTALMGAASQGHTAIVHTLLQAGADASVRNQSGRTARDIAETFRRPAAAQLLEEFAALPSSRTSAGWSTAVFAAPSPCASEVPTGPPSPLPSPRTSPPVSSATLVKDYFDSLGA